MTYLNAKKYIVSLPTDAPEQASGARFRRILEALGNPQKGLRYVTLTGNNGKTVCAEMLMSVYKESDCLVGCYLSGDLKDPRRSVRIDGKPLSAEEASELIATVRAAVQKLNKVASDEDGKAEPFTLTRTELFVVMALLAFHNAGCRLCLMESDPSQPDATRYLPAPFGAVICGAIPHEDRKEMQSIRASIRHGIREIVSAPQNREAHALIANTCASIQCRLTIPARSEIVSGKQTLRSTEFSYGGRSFRLGLCGKFQITNATVVLETLAMLARMGYAVTDEQKARGLANIQIPCKFEILSSSPTIIADSTHVGVAIGTVLESLSDFRSMIGSKIHLLLPDGELADAYAQTLREMDYDLKRIVLLSDRTESDGILFRYAKKKDAICSALNMLASDEILLISGPSDFTEEIRYDLLQALGF